jgi:hypothetical protein
MTEKPAGTNAKHLPRIWKITSFIAAMTIGLWVLLVSREPSVVVQSPPSAQSVRLAREAIKQLDGFEGTSSGQLRLNNETLDGLSSLAASLTGMTRVEAQLASGKLLASASVPLPTSHWLNIFAEFTSNPKGFPDLRLRAGRLHLPVWAGRPLAQVARWVLRLKGVELPPLDVAVKSFRVTDNELLAELALPPRRGMIDRVMTARGVKLNDGLVASAYCQLATQQKDAPSNKLEVQLQRAFAGAPAVGAESYNRAVLVALAMFVVGDRAEGLAPVAAAEVRKCREGKSEIVLSERTDLAKHWALSAALGAVLGEGAASALGEWKELSDSLPNGSGFSFADLAANRSGLRIARRAIVPATAASTAKQLATVQKEELFPISLIAAQEGLSEEEFLRRYGNVQAANYQATIQWIDRKLDQTLPDRSMREAGPSPAGH